VLTVFECCCANQTSFVNTQATIDRRTIAKAGVIDGSTLTKLRDKRDKDRLNAERVAANKRKKPTPKTADESQSRYYFILIERPWRS